VTCKRIARDSRASGSDVTILVARGLKKVSKGILMAHMHDRWRRVSEKAFELYQSRGGVDGRHLDDWLEAERLIDEEDERTGAARDTPEEFAAAADTTAAETTPEARDTESRVVRRGNRRRSKSATL